MSVECRGTINYKVMKFSNLDFLLLGRLEKWARRREESG